jgi:hypothetical protein
MGLRINKLSCHAKVALMRQVSRQGTPAHAWYAGWQFPFFFISDLIGYHVFIILLNTAPLFSSLLL